MKADFVQPPPPPTPETVVAVTMSLAEARDLRAFLSNSTEGSLYNLWVALRDLKFKVTSA